MRITLICMLLVGMIVFTTGCNDKSNENGNQSFGEPTDLAGLDRSTASEIYGTWKLKEWFENEPKDINKDGQKSTDLLSQWNGCYKESELVLSSDLSGKIVYTGSSNNPRCPSGFESGDFKTTDNWELINEDDIKYLRFVGDDYDDIYEIIELNDETLTLEGAGFLTCCASGISYYTDGYLNFEKK